MDMINETYIFNICTCYKAKIGRIDNDEFFLVVDLSESLY